MTTERLCQADGFSVFVSLDPPKGTDTQVLKKHVERIKGRVDGVLIGDSPDAIMRMSPLAACMKVREMGVSPILGMNSRDRNRLAIQGDLLGAWAMGISDIVFEVGKDPSYGDHPLTKPCNDVSRSSLLEGVSGLNDGKDMADQSLKGATQFRFGTWVQWLDGEDGLDAEFRNMETMAQDGAMAFLVSPQFDVERTKKLIDRAAGFGVPVYVSVMLLKSVGMARYLNEVPGVSKVPDNVIDTMKNAPVKSRAGVDVATGFIKEMEGVAAGVVLLPIGWEHKVPEVLEGIGR